MKILGIDPALNKTGWGVIEIIDNNVLKYVASGIIEVSKEPDMVHKLKAISRQLAEIVATFLPDEIAIEETFVNKNPATSLKLGHARGAMMATCLNHTDHIYEYGANQIKKSVCGVGKAEKQQVAMMVKVLLPQAQFEYDDESDALAVAITHHHLRSFNEVLKSTGS